MIPSQDSLTQLSQKIAGHVKVQSGAEKKSDFHVLNSQLCFENIINMQAASRTISFLLQNRISSSVISGNKRFESFSEINWFQFRDKLVLILR